MIKETFADESWQGNFWLRPTVLAQISSDTDLHWFCELVKITQAKGLNLEELKSSVIIDLLKELDPHIKYKIWQGLQNVIIIINDPKQYLSKWGIKILNGSIFKIELEKGDIIINGLNPNYKYFIKLLQDLLSQKILFDSTASNIAYSIREISCFADVFPVDENYFDPDSILKIMDKKDPRKRIINSTKLSPRLSSAFFELKDPETKYKIFENSLQERRYFSPAYYHLELLCRSISPARFFDEGDRLSISIIKRFQEVISQGLQHPIFNNRYTLSFPKVEELDSKKDIRIQAADVAAGIARNIYERYNIKGLRDRFDYIIFNGNKL